MSLIEEALRKQREENEKEGGAPVATPSPASLPPDADPSEISTVEEPVRRSWALLAGIVGAGVIAILFLVWLLVFGLKLWQTKPTAPSTVAIGVTNAPKASVVNQSAIHTNETPKPATPAPLPATAPSVPIPPPQAALPPAPATPITPHEAQAIPGPALPEKPNTQNQKNSTPSPAPTKLEMPVLWPKLTVSGIIGSSKSGRSAAIMNGQMLSPGESIEGVTIESIDKQKVKLRYNGEIKSLSVGASTE